MSKIEIYKKNLKEIKELSKKLEEPLEEPYTSLCYHINIKQIKYEGGYIDNKYEGRGKLYGYNGKMEYNGYFSNNEYNGFGNKYGYYGKLEYEGFFTNSKKNGKGILYFDNNEKIYFNGIFDMDNYIEGILYDLNGNIIYEGLFINNKPKEGKNLKLYTTRGSITYEGDLLNGQYHGNGTLYVDNKFEHKFTKYIGEFKNGKFDGHGKIYLGEHLFYEGNFRNNYFSGEGIIYYYDQKKYYVGHLENNLMNGEGTKYYTNGNIKIKGSFSNDKCIQGIYYNPDAIKIYEGEFKNGNPIESKNIVIYDNEGNKIYEGEIHNGLYEGEGIEYFPLLEERILFKGKFNNNLYELPDFDIIEDKDKRSLNSTKIVLLSKGDAPGKTWLFCRLLGDDYYEEMPATIGFDKGEIPYENKNTRYKLKIFDTSGNERYLSPSLEAAKKCMLALYLFDLNSSNGVSIDFIKEIKEMADNIKIYIVGNKLDLFSKFQKINNKYLEANKNSIIEALKSNLVDKYFEISVKTGEGIDKLMNSIKYDSLKYLEAKNDNPVRADKDIKKIKKKEKDKCIIY